MFLTNYESSDNVATLSLATSCLAIIYYILVTVVKNVSKTVNEEIRFCTTVSNYECSLSNYDVKSLYCSLLNNHSVELYFKTSKRNFTSFYLYFLVQTQEQYTTEIKKLT
eukprot:UN03006